MTLDLKCEKCGKSIHVETDCPKVIKKAAKEFKKHKCGKVKK